MFIRWNFAFVVRSKVYIWVRTRKPPVDEGEHILYPNLRYHLRTMRRFDYRDIVEARRNHPAIEYYTQKYFIYY